MTSNIYTLLSPVKEEDLRLTFGHSTAVQQTTTPEALFIPTIEQFKKLAIGSYLWFVADTTKWVVAACGGALELMLGIKDTAMLHEPPQIMFNKTHPDDLVQMFAFSNYWVQYFMQLPDERKAHNRATIYLRMLNADNRYNWMMVQYADQLMDCNGKILYGLTFITNIQHIKNDGIASMSILDTYDESCQQFICVDGKSMPNNNISVPITNREIEVLRLLAKGNSSKQITVLLNIAQKTIDNHRQNMLHKTACLSTGELVAYGIKNGYV